MVVIQARLNGSAQSPDTANMSKKDLREKDQFNWMTCSDKENHEVEELMLSQIVAGESMNLVFSTMHEICTLWNISLQCGCPSHPFPESMVNINFILLEHNLH